VDLGSTSQLIQLAVHERGVAILIPGERVTSRALHRRPDSAVDCHGAGLQVVSETHSRHSWDPIPCVLLFPYGTDIFHLEIPKDGKAKSVTAMEYYRWRLMQRDGRA